MFTTDQPRLALELAQAGPRPIAAYLHVPFCYRRCGYCNFSLLANREDLHERFVDAILIELSSLQAPQPVETLFLGGGTLDTRPRSDGTTPRGDSDLVASLWQS